MITIATTPKQQNQEKQQQQREQKPQLKPWSSGGKLYSSNDDTLRIIFRREDKYFWGN